MKTHSHKVSSNGGAVFVSGRCDNGDCNRSLCGQAVKLDSVRATAKLVREIIDMQDGYFYCNRCSLDGAMSGAAR